MTALASVLFLALSRAEIIARFRAPVVTQASGLVQVYANCPEDMRREYQSPIAGFAADTVKTLYGGRRQKPVRFERPGIVIHVGDVRTNLPTVVTRVVTNDERIVTRLYVPSPGTADLHRLRLEVVKGYFRALDGRELDDVAAAEAYESADPALRLMRERQAVERFWLTAAGDFEEGLRKVLKVIQPGRASRRDVLTFASRLYLYPPRHDLLFLGRYESLSFREALKLAADNPAVRLAAAVKAGEMPVFGGGRGAALKAAALRYEEFLRAFAAHELSRGELEGILDEAETKLNLAYEEADKFDRGELQ